MTRKGRGWHGDSYRHSLAARGIPSGHVERQETKQEHDDRVMEFAEEKMDRVIKRIDPEAKGMVATPHLWQFSMRHQELITKMLEEIIFDLKRVELNNWMEDELATAEGELELAWGGGPRKPWAGPAAFDRGDRNIQIEMARERLHGIIVSYNSYGFAGAPQDYYYDPGPPGGAADG